MSQLLLSRKWIIECSVPIPEANVERWKLSAELALDSRTSCIAKAGTGGGIQRRREGKIKAGKARHVKKIHVIDK